MYDPVHEKIKVDAIFENGKVSVTRFKWKDKVYKVNEVTLITKAYRGRDTVWLVYVTTLTAAYKLRFDTDTLNWWMEELSWEETSESQ